MYIFLNEKLVHSYVHIHCESIAVLCGEGMLGIKVRNRLIPAVQEGRYTYHYFHRSNGKYEDQRPLM